MKKYEVTKKYIIEAQDETHLRVKLYNAYKFPDMATEWHCVQEYYRELPITQKRARKKGRNAWVAALTSQLKLLVFGK